jgi:hypothetical protein
VDRAGHRATSRAAAEADQQRVRSEHPSRRVSSGVLLWTAPCVGARGRCSPARQGCRGAQPLQLSMDAAISMP